MSDPTSINNSACGTVATSTPGPDLPANKDVPEDEIGAARDQLFAQGSNFKPVKREEIVGIDELLDDIDEIIHWLRHPQDYSYYGARLESGIILAGSPGTGKTTTARYIASESDALFINVRDFAHKGSLFTDSDIRDLFARARAAYQEHKVPILLFWDEFEGVAAERSNNDTSPDQASVVSQLTSELEGALGKNEGIVLVGCTNYLYNIDNALRRSGRLGIQYEFHAPDREGKQAILVHYLSKMTTTKEIDTETLSYFFDREATAADIEEACMQAWRHSVHRYIDRRMTDNTTKPSLSQADLIKVFIRRLVGPPTTQKLPKDERVRIAIHEIGHAIVAMVYGVPVRLITVQPGKKALGRTMIDELAEYITTHEEVVNWIRVGAGGIVAERTAELPEMVGSQGDIAAINQQAARLIDTMGYGEETGLFNIAEYTRRCRSGIGGAYPSASEEAVLRSDRECKTLVDRIQQEATIVLGRVGKDAIWKMAEVLNEEITMTGAQFQRLFLDVTNRTPSKFYQA